MEKKKLFTADEIIFVKIVYEGNRHLMYKDAAHKKKKKTRSRFSGYVEGKSDWKQIRLKANQICFSNQIKKSTVILCPDANRYVWVAVVMT